jgi:hypothetical protein
MSKQQNKLQDLEQSQPSMSHNQAAESVAAIEPPELWTEFAADYRSHLSSEENLVSYLDRCVDELSREGKPVLSTVLQCRFPGIRVKTMELISQNPNLNTVRLQLLPDCDPPIRDYNGALLPKEKHGKVLAAKIGLTSEFDVRYNARGTNVNDEKYTGPVMLQNERIARRTYLSKLGRYKHIEVFKDKPITLDFGMASRILQRYGYGIAADESFWFVVEV